MIRSYQDLRLLKTFNERFEYLRLDGVLGEETFGVERNLNQTFYKSNAWLEVRRHVIARDHGYDLGVPGYNINAKLIVHHINPITIDDLSGPHGINPSVFDLDNLISTSLRTHNAIHYGSLASTPQLIERKPGDTVLWEPMSKEPIWNQLP